IVSTPKVEQPAAGKIPETVPVKAPDKAPVQAVPPARPIRHIPPGREREKFAPAAKTREPLAFTPKRVVPKAPEIPVAKEAATTAAKKAPAKWEIERDKKKGKKPVEVIIGTDQAPSRKKSLIKKIVDRKEKVIEVDHEERPGKWREEKKQPVARMKKTEITVPKAIKRRIKIGETITVGDLAKKMGVKAGEVINKLMGLGIMATINQSVDFDTATLLAAEFSYQVEAATFEYEESLIQMDATPRNLKPRAPVVTIMGHVDHGKTSLLDAIRETNVIGGEAGGITQAIGAYHVHINNRDIVFLDTPGHEAFTAMRARGAQVTDIVVLVVAADDGVMDQTIEAINHSRAAGVPIMVAINKIDKPNADPQKIKQALTEYNLVSEEWGGDTIFCEVSAKQKINIEELLELILLQADVLELRADPDRLAHGVVIEAKLDRGRGPVATVLIQEGTLREGDIFACKTEYGKVRAMYNDQSKRVKEAGPSMPVEVIGFSRVPQASAEFVGVEDEKKARSMADYWMRKEREKELSATSKITLEQLYEKIKEGVKDLNVIIKGDVQGSIEALAESLNKLSTADIKLKIIHSSAGAITETDVMLASSANAVIIGFNVRPDGHVAEIAEHEGVEIKLYDIIYNVIADVRAAMEGLLEPIYKEVVQGRAEVRQLFKVPKVGTIAGCYVSEGKITRNAGVKLVRDGVVVYDGRIGSLKRLKDDVREVMSGFECGIGIDNFNDIREGDVIESYINERIERKL
ncbi:MAG: translation initiation factor IF-2, partial [Syntrophales bacterium]|nr:translation initiation factor IF-2 [Syntrophales bacterium]